MNDFHRHLPRRDSGENVLPEAGFFDAVAKFARNAEMHIGGEKRGAHVGESIGDIRFGDLAESAQIAQGVSHAIGQIFKHERK